MNGKLPTYRVSFQRSNQPAPGLFGIFNATQSKEMEAALEEAILSTEAVLAGMSSTGCLETDAESYRLLEKLFEVVMCLTHPNLFAAKIAALRLFIPIFKKDPRALDACLKSLGSIIESSKKSTISYQPEIHRRLFAEDFVELKQTVYKLFFHHYVHLRFRGTRRMTMPRGSVIFRWKLRLQSRFHWKCNRANPNN